MASPTWELPSINGRAHFGWILKLRRAFLFTGISCATPLSSEVALRAFPRLYELVLKGQNVVVIDRGAISGGITARTTAHLAPLCDDLMSEMIKVRGLEASRMFYESQAEAVDRIEQIQKQEGIDCDFRRVDGYLFQAPETDSSMIDDELEAVRSVGAPVHRVVGVPLRGCEGRHALRYPKQATFHPLKYLKGLAEKILGEKGRIFSDTTALKISERDRQVTVRTDRGTVTASACVVATNSPVSNLFSLHSKMAPYRSYALSFPLKADVIPDALYWDTEDPYHYVRINPDKDGLVSSHRGRGGPQDWRSRRCSETI